jgi:hypothetical protein
MKDEGAAMKGMLIQLESFLFHPSSLILHPFVVALAPQMSAESVALRRQIVRAGERLKSVFEGRAVFLDFSQRVAQTIPRRLL